MMTCVKKEANRQTKGERRKKRTGEALTARSSPIDFSVHDFDTNVHVHVKHTYNSSSTRRAAAIAEAIAEEKKNQHV